MVGCTDPEVYKKAEPILNTMGSYVFHMGNLGSGHVMKTFNNYIMASSLCALSDSLVMGQKWGLNPQTMIDVCNVGTSVCFPTLDVMRRDGITGRYNSGFGLALLAKDLGICEDFMKREGYETEQPTLIKKYVQQALENVEPTADHSKIIAGYEKRAGLEVKKTSLSEVKAIPAEDFEHRLSGLNRGLQ